MRSAFRGGAYKSRHLPLSAQTAVNIYWEPNESGVGEEGAWLGTPGLLRLATLESNVCRGLRVAGRYLWGVYGSSIYRFDRNFVATEVGTLPNYRNPVGMDDNGTDLVIAHGDGWTAVNLETSAVSVVANAPTMSDVSFIDNYLVGANENGTYQWANLNSTTVEALNFASAEGSPDNIVRTLTDHRELWLFGEETIEVAVVNTDTDLPFTRTSFIEQGILAPRSAAKEDNRVFWLGRNRSGQGAVYVAEGYTPRDISTFALEQAIATYASPEDAVAYTYQQDGHHFYVLSFAEATWAYDINTGEWAQRGYRSPESGGIMRHRAAAHAFWRGTHVVGDFEDNRLYALDLDTFTDDGDHIYRERAWKPFPSAENRRTRHHRAELIAEMGVGNGGMPPNTTYLTDEIGNILITEDGMPILLEESTEFGAPGAYPEVALQLSKDGGHSFGNAHKRPLGMIGQYQNRALWRRLGLARDLVCKVWTDAPVRVAWMGFNFDTDVTNG